MGNASPRSSLSYEQQPFIVKNPWELTFNLGPNCSLTDGLRAAKEWGCGIKYTGSNEIVIWSLLHHKRLIHSAHRKTASIALISYVRAVSKTALAKAGPKPMAAPAPAIAGGLDPVEKFRQMKISTEAPTPTPPPPAPQPEPALDLRLEPATPAKKFSGRSMAHSAIRQIDELVYKYHYSSGHIGTFRDCPDTHCECARSAFKTIKTMGQKLESAASSKDENEELFIETADENERLKATIGQLTDQVKALSGQLEKVTPKAPPSPGSASLYASVDGSGNVFARGRKLFSAADIPLDSDTQQLRQTKYHLLLQQLRAALDEVWVGEARSLTNFIDALDILITQSHYSTDFVQAFQTLNFNRHMLKLGSVRRPGGQRNMLGPLAGRIIKESLERLRSGRE